jgi:hypothetical protein
MEQDITKLVSFTEMLKVDQDRAGMVCHACVVGGKKTLDKRYKKNFNISMKVCSGLNKLLKKVAISISVIVSLMVITPVEKSHASFINAGTEPTQIAHMGINTGGWLNDAYNWGQQRIDELNKLTQLITNNVFTEAIRGFNELMTAIQTDISQVLGTIQTLFDLPNDIFKTLISVPMSILNQLGQAGGGFLGLYEDAMGIFKTVGNAQGLGIDLPNFSRLFTGGYGGIGGGYGGIRDAYDFQTKVSGLRTALNADFLDTSQVQERERKYRQWTTDARYDGRFGGDAVQIAATTANMIGELNKAVNRDAEFAALDRLQESADRLSAYEQSKARAAGSWNRGTAFIGETIY